MREATTGFLYRGKGYCCLPVFFGTQNAPFTQQASASVSYITGAHALKVGFQNDFGTLEQQQLDNEQGLFYTFNNGVPSAIQQHALPFTQTTHLSLDMGIYAQDKWTFKRATINAGLRLDFFKNNFPEQTLGPASFVPNRNVVIPETPYANLKDITPARRRRLRSLRQRQDVAQEQLGQVHDRPQPADGQPALAAGLHREPQLDAQPAAGPPELLHPAVQPEQPGGQRRLRRAGQRALRSAAPQRGDRPGDHHRLGQPRLEPGVLGQRPAADHAARRRGLRLLPALVRQLHRWWTTARSGRPTSRATASPCRPMRACRTADRRSADSTSWCRPRSARSTTTPRSRTTTGSRSSTGTASTSRSTRGRRDGVTLQGGWSTGRTSTDNCDLRAKLPEITTLAAGVAPRQGAPATIGLTGIPDSQCHVDTKFLHQYKFLGTYLVPKIDVQFGVTYQATPGPEINANYVVTQAQTIPSTPLPGGLRFVNVLAPGTEYVKHIQQLDIRFSKLLRFGRTRSTLSMDLANALNANYSQAITQAYGPRWTYPVSIMDGRLVKLSAQFDF